MSREEKWSQTPGQSFRFIGRQTEKSVGLAVVLYYYFRLNVISWICQYHTLPLSNKQLFPHPCSLSFSFSVTPFLLLSLSISHSESHLLPPKYTHTHTLINYSFSLLASRCRMACECEKGTSSSVFWALLSTHPFPQWLHWGWVQVKAYLKGLFNTE